MGHANEAVVDNFMMKAFSSDILTVEARERIIASHLLGR